MCFKSVRFFTMSLHLTCFLGPLLPDEDTSKVNSFIDSCLSRQSLSKSSPEASSERLLWAVIRVLIDTRGLAQSEAGSSDPNSPESQIVSLLSKAGSGPKKLFSDIRSSFSDAKDVDEQEVEVTKHQQCSNISVEQRQEIETLLVSGDRDAALMLALQLNQHALAMLIGTVCGKEQFQQAVKAFANHSFSPSSSLHFISMIYSNQTPDALKLEHSLPGDTSQKPRSIGNAIFNGSSSAPLAKHQMVSWEHVSPIVRDWKKHLGSILCNKSGDWVHLARSLGDRIYSESQVRICFALLWSPLIVCCRILWLPILPIYVAVLFLLER